MFMLIKRHVGGKLCLLLVDSEDLYSSDAIIV